MTGPDPAFQAAGQRLPGPPARIGVAVSGGPDSLAALVVVSKASGPRGVPVTALHVDHGLRPERGAIEREIVERVARSLGVPVLVRTVDVLGARARDGGSTEFVARVLRHRALDEMAAESHLTHVVLAHHLEDQIETVLLAILRGAWPAAVAGMRVTRPMPSGAILVRPFLEVPRAALRAHASTLGAAEDAMNDDVRYRRVAVRKMLLPALRARASTADAIVLGIADAARVVDDRALAITEEVLESTYREDGLAVFPAAALRDRGRFARARFLRRLCDDDSSFGHATWPMLAALAPACEPGALVTIEVRRAVRLTARQGVVALFADESPHAPSCGMVWDGAPASFPIDGARRLRIEPWTGSGPGAPETILLDLRPGARIEVRTRRARDRFPLENTGSKLVANELSDRKVQPVWRGRIPLVFVDGSLRWIAGLRAVHGDGLPNARLTIEGPMPWTAGPPPPDRRL